MGKSTLKFQGLKKKKFKESPFKGNVDFQCDFCNILLSSKQNLEKHKKIVHQGLKEHQCKYCDLKFTTKQGVRYHIKYYHEKEKSAKGECTLCNKIVFSPRVLSFFW